MSKKSQFEKQKEIARLKRLRHESFVLNPSKNNLDEEQHLNELNEKYNNSKTTSSPTLSRTISDIKHNFQLDDILDFVHRGIQVIFLLKKN